MTIFKRFAEVFLIFFGVYILYFNLVMALNVVGSDSHITPFLGFYAVDNTRWTSDYYFGFDSIMNTIRAIPSAFQFDNFLALFSKFVDTLSPLSSLFDDFSKLSTPTSGWDVWSMLQTFFNFFSIIFDIILAPFKMLVAFIELNIALFQSIIEALQFIWAIISGKYNSPVDGWTSPLENYFSNSGYNPHSGDIPPVASVGVSGGVVTVY